MVKGNKSQKKGKGQKPKAQKQQDSKGGNRQGKAAGRVFNPNVAPDVKKRSGDVKNTAVEQICRITDPFCRSALGARLPDGSGQQTLTTQVRQLISVPSSAAGLAVLTLAPGWWASQTPATTAYTTGSQTSYTNTSAPSMFDSNAYSARIVNWGVILRTAANSANAQGTLIFGELMNSIPSTTTGNIGDYLLNKVDTAEVFGGMERSIIISPYNNYLARQFLGKTNFQSGATSGATGWPSFVCQLVGGPNAQPTFTAEVFMNLEWTVATDNTMVPLLPPPVRGAPSVMAAADAVKAKLSTVEGGVRTAGQEVAHIATEVIKHSPIGVVENLAGDFFHMLGL